jgi:HAD superfamily hydrolase (TIGR01548 family)
VCASAALRDFNYVKDYSQEVKRSKLILYKELEKLGVKYYKSDANFVLLKIGPQSAEFCQKLREKGILVRNRGSDILLNGCVRITLGTLNQTKELIKALRQVTKEIKPLLIFDIDGVLADVSKSYRAAIKRTAEYFTGTSISFEEIQEFKNRGGLNNDWDLTEAIIKTKGKNVNKERIIRKFQNYYSKLINNEKWLLDKRILKSLSKRYNLAILTGRPRKEAYSVLKRNKISNCFSTIVSMEDIAKQKPNPAGILKILNQYQNLDAYYFGDSIDDMKAAVSANIIPIGVLPPQDKSTFLLNLLMENGAKFVITDINNVTEALK